MTDADLLADLIAGLRELASEWEHKAVEVADAAMDYAAQNSRSASDFWTIVQKPSNVSYRSRR